MSLVQTDSYTSTITKQNGDGETKTESSYRPQKCQLSGIVSRNISRIHEALQHKNPT